MTTNEANLLLTLFFSQHKGKRICDVLTSINDSVMYGISSFRNTNEILSDKGFVLICYNFTNESHQVSIGKNLKFKNINLLNYISFKDLI